jgi:hypothetical protein
MVLAFMVKEVGHAATGYTCLKAPHCLKDAPFPERLLLARKKYTPIYKVFALIAVREIHGYTSLDCVYVLTSSTATAVIDS